MFWICNINTKSHANLTKTITLVQRTVSRQNSSLAVRHVIYVIVILCYLRHVIFVVIYGMLFFVIIQEDNIQTLP